MKFSLKALSVLILATLVGGNYWESSLLAQETPVLINVAPSGIATQSSTHSPFEASLANNGNLEDFSHTSSLPNPVTGIVYWQIDLRRSVEIDSIVLHNRDGCCHSRLRDLTVFVLDDPSTLPDAISANSNLQQANIASVLEGGGLSFTSELLNPENIEGESTFQLGPDQLRVDLVGETGAPVVGRVVVVTRDIDWDGSGNGGNGTNVESLVLSLGEVEVFTEIEIVESDFALTGSLSVNLLDSQDFESNLGRWRLQSKSDGEPRPWRSFDEILENVPTGRQTIEFENVTGWRAPESREVIVVEGQLNELQGVYVRWPTYELDQESHVPGEYVPSHDLLGPQSVRHGEEIGFFVVSPEDNAGSIEMVVVPPEVGPSPEVEYDGDIGLFLYSPKSDDLRSFSVIFTAGALSQTIRITPQARLKPEQEVITSQFGLPEKTSKNYLTITEEEMEQDAGSPFNQLGPNDLVRHITVSGRDLVFESGAANDLYERFNDVEDIHTLEIYADTVIISEPLHLPQTHLIIHAREFHFGPDGLIDLTPIHNLREPSQFVDGQDGRPAGNLKFYVQKFISNWDGRPKFILRGGDGQNGGPGKDGANGQLRRDPQTNAPLDPLTFMYKTHGALAGLRTQWGIPQDAFVAYARWEDWAEPVIANGFDEALDPIGGARRNDILRMLGQDAETGGKPGSPGSGGELRSNLPGVELLGDLLGGQSGTGKAALGGTHAIREYWLAYHSTFWNGFLTGPQKNHLALGDLNDPKYSGLQRTTSTAFEGAYRISRITFSGGRGLGASPLPPDCECEYGESGEFIVLDSPRIWLHPFILKPVIDHARDVYLRGYPSMSRQILEEYLVPLEALLNQESLPGHLEDFEFELKASLQEIVSLIERIDSNLDYFGNPPGWVSLLSFEVGFSALKLEIERSVPALALTHFLKTKSTEIIDRTEALQDAEIKAEENRDRLLLSFNSAQLRLPVLQSQWADVTSRSESVESAIGVVDEQLTQRARRIVEDRYKLPAWKKALKVTGKVLKVVPHPKAQVTGTLLDGLTDVIEPDPSQPSTFEGILNVAEDTLKTYCSNVNKLDADCDEDKTTLPEDHPSAKTQARLRMLKDVVNATREIRDVFKKREAPDDEVQAELEKLRAVDPSLKELTADLQTLLTDKSRLARETEELVQGILDYTAGLEQNEAALVQIDRSLNSLQGLVNHRTLLTLQSLDRRARDRLLYYQYLVMKAFEYRTAIPYGEANPDSNIFKLEALFDEFSNIIQATGDYRIENLDALEAIYVDELQEITIDLIQILSNRPESTQTRQLSLEPSEIAELNENGEITINLSERGVFSPVEENRRLIDIYVRDAEFNLETPIPVTANVDIEFEHSGRTQIRSSNCAGLGCNPTSEVYQFQHARPLIWTSGINVKNGEISPSTPSEAQNSLLAVLLDLDPEGILFYSRPGADSEILIRKRFLGNLTSDTTIESLDLSVQYDYFRMPENELILKVETEEGYSPDILFNHPNSESPLLDVSGRGTGRGTFQRIYAGSQLIQIEAPQDYGFLRFSKWVDANGDELSQEPVFVLNLDSNIGIRAVYTEPESAGTPIFRRGDVDSNGVLEITDPINNLAFQFLGTYSPQCLDACDFDDNGRVEITDPIASLSHQFLGTASPAPPGVGSCGIDPTVDTIEGGELGCEVNSPTCN